MPRQWRASSGRSVRGPAQASPHTTGDPPEPTLSAPFEVPRRVDSSRPGRRAPSIREEPQRAIKVRPADATRFERCWPFVHFVNEKRDKSPTTWDGYGAEFES